MNKIRHKTLTGAAVAFLELTIDDTFDIWEIYALLVACRCGVGVADRDLTARMRSGLNNPFLGAAVEYHWDSDLGGAGDTVRLTAGQYGWIYYDLDGGFGSSNDNGTITLNVLTPGKFRIMRGFDFENLNPGMVGCHITNATGDETLSVSILYKLIGDTFE